MRSRRLFVSILLRRVSVVPFGGKYVYHLLMVPYLCHSYRRVGGCPRSRSAFAASPIVFVLALLASTTFLSPLEFRSCRLTRIYDLY